MIHGIKIDSNETSVETTDLRGVQEIPQKKTDYPLDVPG